MNYIMIENKGELDISSLILLGASTKRDDESKIGFFGSGNKYAIATLIKKKVEFHIFSGEKEIVVTTEQLTFRGKTFERILIDSQQTSLTTDMGPQWEEWMAVREWVSNSLDEGHSNIINTISSISGREGYTRFFIAHTSEIEEVIENWNSYFNFDRDDIKAEHLGDKIFSQTNIDDRLTLYRKGIRVHDSPGFVSLYHYDLGAFIINESRLIESTYMAGIHVLRFLNKITEVSILVNILKNAFIKRTWEANFSWRNGQSDKFSDTWRKAIADKVLIIDNVSGYFTDVMVSKPYYIVSIEFAYQVRRSFPDVIIYGMSDDGEELAFKKVEATKKIDFLLKECISFLEETEYAINYDIELVSFEKSEVLGRAYSNKILLSDKLFELGKKEIVSTIIEECEHLKTGYNDCTRAFQNHLFRLFLSEKEERFGHFL